jgi:Transposase DDE domain group 1
MPGLQRAARRPRRAIRPEILSLAGSEPLSSVSPTHGEQENSVWNGHYACTCYHPLFVFNQFGDLERCTLRPGNMHSAAGRVCLSRSSCGIRARSCVSTSEPMQPSPCRESTSASKLSGSSMRSAFRPTRSFRTGSAKFFAQFDAARQRWQYRTPSIQLGTQFGLPSAARRTFSNSPHAASVLNPLRE